MSLPKPTESELEILNILWDKGACTVREIHEVLEQTKESGYTTTLKLLQIMHDKKLVKRDASSKTHIYKANISQEDTKGKLVQRMIDTVFKGSAMDLVMQALGKHNASTEELEMIRQYLDEQTKGTSKK